MVWEKELPHQHDKRTEKVMKHIPSAKDMDTVSGLMKQLGDPSRLRIFWILCHVEECVVNIAAMTEMSSPAVSHHLRLLKDNGLITARREGKEMYYRAADTPLTRRLHHAVEDVLEISCPQNDSVEWIATARKQER